MGNPLPIKRPEHVETLKQRILLLAIYARRRDKPFEDGKSCESYFAFDRGWLVFVNCVLKSPLPREPRFQHDKSPQAEECSGRGLVVTLRPNAIRIHYGTSCMGCRFPLQFFVACGHGGFLPC